MKACYRLVEYQPVFENPIQDFGTGTTGRKSIPVYVGLDDHQDSVRVCVMDRVGNVLRNGSCENDALVIAAIAENHGTQVRAAIEACTEAADLVDELAQRAGWTMDLAHPGYVARMKQSPDKTDFTDAHDRGAVFGLCDGDGLRMPVTCTKRIQFSAGHGVAAHENKCAHVHGHNCAALITAQAKEVDDVGCVIDFSVLKERVGGCSNFQTTRR